MKKAIIFLMLLMPLLASCTKDIEPASDEIRFNIEFPRTKVGSLGFEVGDSLSLFAVERMSDEKPPLQIGGNFFNNEMLIYSGSLWKGNRKLYWSDHPCDFYAIYPYQRKIESIEEFDFHIVADQRGNGYDLSDLLYASKMNVRRSDGAVNMQFNHVMTKLIVRLNKGEKYEGSIPDDSEVHIYNTLSSCLIDLTDGTVALNSFAGREKVTMHKIDNSTFEAILVPQNIEKRTPLVEVTMGGISYLLEYSISLRKGYQHTITLTINTSPDQENIEIGVDPGIKDW